MPVTGDGLEASSWPELIASLRPRQESGGEALIAAILLRLAGHCAAPSVGPALLPADDPRLRFRLSVQFRRTQGNSLQSDPG